MSADLLTPTARLLAPSGLPREDWLAVRRAGIGGSDVAAILGMDRYHGPLHVYLDKRGEAVPERRDVQLERSARRGNRLEGLVAEFFAEETGHAVIESPGTLQHATRPWMLANADRLVVEAPQGGVAAAVYEPDAALPYGVAGPLECKSRTWRSARTEDWRGEEPPDGPALQAYWYRAVMGYRRAYVAGLVDDDFVFFELADDQELIDHLVKVVSDFWHDHVVAGVPPEPGDLDATGDLLNHLWDVSADSVKLFTAEEVAESDRLLTRRAEIITERKELKRELGAIENRLKAKLGDAEIALAPGRELYSWRRNGTFAAKRFREAHQDIAADLQRQVHVLDIEALKETHPDLYRAHRARILRTPGSPS